MSYPKDLDEYTDEELKRELARRERCKKEGRCSYCGRLAQTNPVSSP